MLKHQVNRFRTICTVCGFVALSCRTATTSAFTPSAEIAFVQLDRILKTSSAAKAK